MEKAGSAEGRARPGHATTSALIRRRSPASGNTGSIETNSRITHRGDRPGDGYEDLLVNDGSGIIIYDGINPDASTWPGQVDPSPAPVAIHHVRVRNAL